MPRVAAVSTAIVSMVTSSPNASLISPKASAAAIAATVDVV